MYTWHALTPQQYNHTTNRNGASVHARATRSGLDPGLRGRDPRLSCAGAWSTPVVPAATAAPAAHAHDGAWPRPTRPAPHVHDLGTAGEGDERRNCHVAAGLDQHF